MGNDVSPIRVTMGRVNRQGVRTEQGSYKAAFLEADGHKMTIQFFDRNDDKVWDDSDAAQVGVASDKPDDVKYFTTNAKKLAAAEKDIFADCSNGGNASENTKDKDEVDVTRVNGKIDSITFGSSPIKLGVLRSTLQELARPAGGNGNGGQGAGAPQGQGGSMTTPNMSFPSLPNCSGILSGAYEYGYRSMMLSDSPQDTSSLYSGAADLQMTLATIKNSEPFFANALQALASMNGGGYTPSGTGASSGSSSNSSSADDASDKKADAIKKARDEKEAARVARDKKIEEAKTAKEKEASAIVNDAYTAIKNSGGIGTDNEKLLKTVKNINKDNVVEVLDAWEKSQYASEMNEKSLIKLIGDVTDGYSNIESYENVVSLIPGFGLLSPVYSAIKGEKVSQKYLNPIKDALRRRSESNESGQLANQVDSNYSAHFKLNDSAAIDKLDELYGQVRKEEKADNKKIPLVIAVDKEIQAEADKAKADEGAKAKTQAVTDSSNALQAKILEAAKYGISASANDTVETLQPKIDAAKATAQAATKNKKSKAVKAPTVAVAQAPLDAQAAARRAAFRAKMNQQALAEQAGGPVADAKDEKKADDKKADGTPQTPAAAQSKPAQPAAKAKTPVWKQAINKIRNAI